MKKKILLALGGLLILLLLFFVWFDYTFSMDVVEGYEVNQSGEPNKLLIATQGSEYKKEIVDSIVKNYTDASVYIKVIDVSSLADVRPEAWDALIILHTWEVWKPEANAKKFLDTSYDADKMFVVATSGDGGNMIEGVDGITSASLLENVPDDVAKIISFIDLRLGGSEVREPAD